MECLCVAHPVLGTDQSQNAFVLITNIHIIQQRTYAYICASISVYCLLCRARQGLRHVQLSTTTVHLVHLARFDLGVCDIRGTLLGSLV